jgi:hypothetical protein
MLTLNQPLPQSSLAGRRFVLGLVPKDQEVVDYVYYALVIEESFEDGLIYGFSLGKRRLGEEKSHANRYDYSFEARHSQLRFDLSRMRRRLCNG